MPDFVLVDGDKAVFSPSFGIATVVVKPVALKAHGPFEPFFKTAASQRKVDPWAEGVDSKRVCVEGDERSIQVVGCSYTTPLYPIPGLGMITIQDPLPPQFYSSRDKLMDGRTKLLLRGGQFQAVFQVSQPAMQAPAPQEPGGGARLPDPTSRYGGTGMFVTKNSTRQAT